jgi:hypothetical protein
MIRFRRFLPCAAALVAAILLGAPNKAAAGFELKLQDNGGAVTTVLGPDAGPVTFSGKVGVFQIFISEGSSNSPGGSTALTQEATFTITNTSGSTHTLHVSASAQDFTSPQSPPPLSVFDTVSGSLVNGTVSGNFQGFADAGNVLFGKGYTGPLLTIPSTSGNSVSFSQNGSSPNSFSPNGATYSMSVFQNLNLSGHGSLTLTGGNEQIGPQTTPAPAGILLGLAGLPFFGVWSYRRRKQPVQLAI